MFDSSMRPNKYDIGEESNEKLSHKIHFPRKDSEPCLCFLPSSKSSMQRSSSIMPGLDYATDCDANTLKRFQ